MFTTVAARPHSIRPYSRLGLALYDSLIVNGLAPHVWGCPPQRLIDHYNRHISDHHADIGVGTGWVLDACRFPTPRPWLTLIDLHPGCLDQASRRLARFGPSWWQRDVLKPLDVPGAPFASLALGGVLHCLSDNDADGAPGGLRAKAVVFDHAAAALRPGGVVFGYTLTSDNAATSLRRRLAMAVLNGTRVICNRRDTAADLREVLKQRFDAVEVIEVGTFALFSAVKTPATSMEVRRAA